MKKLILTLMILACSFNTISSTLADLTPDQIKVVAKYVENEWGPNTTIEEAIEDSYIGFNTISINGFTYIALPILMGDNASGPIYNPESLEIVGHVNDGDVYFY